MLPAPPGRMSISDVEERADWIENGTCFSPELRYPLAKALRELVGGMVGHGNPIPHEYFERYWRNKLDIIATEVKIDLRKQALEKTLQLVAKLEAEQAA